MDIDTITKSLSGAINSIASELGLIRHAGESDADFRDRIKRYVAASDLVPTESRIHEAIEKCHPDITTARILTVKPGLIDVTVVYKNNSVGGHVYKNVSEVFRKMAPAGVAMNLQLFCEDHGGVPAHLTKEIDDKKAAEAHNEFVTRVRQKVRERWG